MALKFFPNGLENFNHYYICFDSSTRMVLHVDCGKCKVEAVNIKKIESQLMLIRPIDLGKVPEARAYDSSDFRMVLCFFDRFYVTVGTMQVSEFATPADYMREMRVSLYRPRVFSPVRRGAGCEPVADASPLGERRRRCATFPLQRTASIPDPAAHRQGVAAPCGESWTVESYSRHEAPRYATCGMRTIVRRMSGA